MELIWIPWLLALLLWGAFFLRRGGLNSLLLVAFLTACCFSHPFINFKLGPLPLTVDRILIGSAAVVYAYYRRRDWLSGRSLTKAELAFGAMLLALFGSLLTHDFKMDNFAPAMKFWLFWLMPATAYFVVRRSGDDVVFANRWQVLLLALTVYLGVTALAESREMWSVVFPRYIAQPGEYFGRARGPFLNPISLGIFLCVGMAAAVIRIPQATPSTRFLLLTVCLAATVGVYFTYTRMVWFSYLVVGAMMVGSLLPRNLRAPVAAFAMMVVVVLVASNPQRLLEFKRDKNADAEATKDSVHVRPIFAAVAWRMFVDRPFAGCGFGQYSVECVHYLDDRSTPLHLQRARNFVQHNVFFSVVCEAGLTALVPFLFVLGFWSRDAWRLIRAPNITPAAKESAWMFVAVVIPYVANGMFHDVSLCSTVNLLLGYSAGAMAKFTDIAALRATAGNSAWTRESTTARA